LIVADLIIDFVTQI